MVITDAFSENPFICQADQNGVITRLSTDYKNRRMTDRWSLAMMPLVQ
jgi:hypothetical protein